MELSIIIITLNEEYWIKRILKSLEEQTFKDFEIIVSDANSTDKTRQISLKHGCKIVNGGTWSVGRNNGARIAKTDYLLFLDADCILPKDFLEINFKKFKNSKKGTGTVPIKPLSNNYFDKIFFKIYDYWSILISRISPHCAGCGIFSRKDVFYKIGGFDENVIFAENHDFTRRAKKYGFMILPREMYTSVRRMDKEGRITFILKYLYGGMYRLVNSEIKKNLFTYSTLSKPKHLKTTNSL